MDKMCFKVEFIAGTSIKDAIEEAKLKAYQLNMAYINFNFNGINFSIGPNANTKVAIQEYKKRSGSVILR